MRTYKKITDLIGNTPLLELESIEKNTGATVFGKLEYFNLQSCRKRQGQDRQGNDRRRRS